MGFALVLHNGIKYNMQRSYVGEGAGGSKISTKIVFSNLRIAEDSLIGI
jgi:hypothetical protein